MVVDQSKVLAPSIAIFHLPLTASFQEDYEGLGLQDVHCRLRRVD